MNYTEIRSCSYQIKWYQILCYYYYGYYYYY